MLKPAATFSWLFLVCKHTETITGKLGPLGIETYGGFFYWIVSIPCSWFLYAMKQQTYGFNSKMIPRDMIFHQTKNQWQKERQFLVYLPVNFGQTYVFLLVILPRPSNRKPSPTFYCMVSKHNLSYHQSYWNDLKFNVCLLIFAISLSTWNAITTICPPQSPL